MARIDTSKISGYEEMSAEDKLNALLGYEFDVPKPDEVEKLKASLSKANSEAAEWKRQFREKQTEAEREAAERAENEAKKDELLRAYQERERVSSYKAKLMTAGVDADTADIMAKNLPDGVGDEYFATYQSFMENKTKEIEAAALGKQPGLSVGTPPEAKSSDDKIVDIAMKYAGLNT